jgi:hypothetical protein
MGEEERRGRIMHVETERERDRGAHRENGATLILFLNLNRGNQI